MDSRTVADAGEDALVAHVLAALGAPRSPDVLVPAGDDAAVLATGGAVVVSTDTLVAGVDFREDWSSGREVGRKTVVQVLADVAAMGARPTGLVVSLAAPGHLPLAWAEELAAGLREEVAAAGADVLGGDVAESPVAVVTGTGLGVLDGPAPAVTRAGARPGDLVVLGPMPGRPLGASAAGLAVLGAGPGVLEGLLRDPDAEVVEAVRLCLAAHRAPAVDHAAGARARAAGATAMIDVSDGLVRDATRLARASGVVLDLSAAALAAPAVLERVATALGEPAGTAGRWVLTSGEEHAMLATVGADATGLDGWRVVGTCRAAPDGAAPVLLDGEDVRRRVGGAGGWTHYGRRPGRDDGREVP
ncbi:thiamine-phosphate kinase [Aquipuribacter sp. SD81]|uniref:thiamine-phosphate kinase n=1 Tax=Aquipuribacter sp. SD81 TaxID=3127703 RepID=UPI00301B2A2B